MMLDTVLDVLAWLAPCVLVGLGAWCAGVTYGQRREAARWLQRQPYTPPFLAPRLSNAEWARTLGRMDSTRGAWN